MDSISPSARTYLWLGCAALVHAVVALGFGYFVFSTFGTDHDRPARLWVSVVTLWLFWPIILALHTSRSWRRCALFAFLGSALLWPNLGLYSDLAPEALGLPAGMKMNPVSAWKYSRAYLAGRTQARRDIAGGTLAIEDAGLKPGHERWDGPVLRERFKIEIRTLEGSIVTEKEVGHRDGYNSVSVPEIDRRFGWDRVQEARGDALKALSDRDEQAVRELTQRLSTIPPNSKVITQLIRPYLDNQPLRAPAAEQRLAPVVRAIEQSVMSAVPEETSSFELHISANLEPGARPSFEMSSPLNPAPPVWQAISNTLDTMPSPEWRGGSLSVGFDFFIRPPR